MNDTARQRSSPDGERGDGLLTDLAAPWNLLGIVLGVGVGVWASQAHSVLQDESTVLLAIAGAAVALLAIVLASIAIMAAFLQGAFGKVIAKKGGVRAFFRPFEIVAVVSGVAGLLGFVGAINGPSGTNGWRDVLFGFASGFMAAAIVGMVGLVFKFVRYAEWQRELEGP